MPPKVKKNPGRKSAPAAPAPKAKAAPKPKTKAAAAKTNAKAAPPAAKAKPKAKAAAAKPRAVKPVKPALAPSQIGWTFLSNHAHVLISLAGDPAMLMREVALRVGITERAVQRIISDLERDGYLARVKVGRRNTYKIEPGLPLRHPVEAHRKVKDLIRLASRE